MARIVRTGLIAVLTLCMAVCPAQAQKSTESVFFEALYDIPVMPGLEELKDQAMLFDKPDGRIASVVAASRRLGRAEITAFYDEVLPQLGWKKTLKNQYVRGGDRLQMDVMEAPPLTAVHFTLSPARR